ncbi:hypothetical protein F3Y22_tig00116959pilonHSYRG00076 [Hibiscus syriacus]|uniref:Uncharacterized protein n=1 Tax=Hibiscus syriacus TaxID=106335 RepID=A0A6A2WXG6_HIBSY|nr:hypothetical protein F3Y22_tig00116959pilonHSYRG00076 [Hibiscus syriacus]
MSPLPCRIDGWPFISHQSGSRHKGDPCSLLGNTTTEQLGVVEGDAENHPRVSAERDLDGWIIPDLTVVEAGGLPSPFISPSRDTTLCNIGVFKCPPENIFIFGRPPTTTVLRMGTPRYNSLIQL